MRWAEQFFSGAAATSALIRARAWPRSRRTWMRMSLSVERSRLSVWWTALRCAAPPYSSPKKAAASRRESLRTTRNRTCRNHGPMGPLRSCTVGACSAVVAACSSGNLKWLCGRGPPSSLLPALSCGYSRYAVAVRCRNTSIRHAQGARPFAPVSATVPSGHRPQAALRARVEEKTSRAARVKAGMSSGLRLEIQLPSTTTSRSSQVAPALR